MILKILKNRRILFRRQFNEKVRDQLTMLIENRTFRCDLIRLEKKKNVEGKDKKIEFSGSTSRNSFRFCKMVSARSTAFD